VPRLGLAGRACAIEQWCVRQSRNRGHRGLELRFGRDLSRAADYLTALVVQDGKVAVITLVARPTVAGADRLARMLNLELDGDLAMVRQAIEHGLACVIEQPEHEALVPLLMDLVSGGHGTSSGTRDGCAMGDVPFE
jgi:hypothetical protein